MARTFVLIALVQYVLQQVSCSTKRSHMHPNTLKRTKTFVLGSNGEDQVHLLGKITTWLRGTNFVLIAPVQYVLHQLSCTYETIRNAPNYYETHRNISLGSNGVDGVRWLRKITMRLRGTNFCINSTSSICFATSFMQLRNDPKCTQILRNAPKHWFRVQWGGLVAFVVKNPDVTSWHEHLQ